MNTSRLSKERREIRNLPLLRDFRLYEHLDVSAHSWTRYFWQGLAPSFHRITAHYPASYPYAPLKIFVSPDVSTHHKWPGGSLCLMRTEQWSPNYTAATIIAIAIRFLDENQYGETE